MNRLLLVCALLASLTAFVTSDFLIKGPGHIEKRSVAQTVTRNEVEVYSVKIDSKVTSRFSHNVVTSRAVNRANTSKEIFFDVDLPKTAFITNFSMTIDGVTYPGTVKEKETAKKQYDQAVSRGQTAGLVKASGRKTEKFTVSVNVASESKVTFELIYEELLKRHLGKYELILKVKPKQLINHFEIEANIYEPQGIKSLDAHGTFITNDLQEITKTSFSGNKGHVSFKPSVDQQRSCANCSTTLLDGDFTISYDVNRESAGNVQIVNGYFVHFFAPANLPTVPKNVVFVIDKSGSMNGRKMDQTKEALLKILEDIKEHDHFNFILFDNRVEPWKQSLIQATAENVEEAKAFVKTIRDDGWTNINDPLLRAIEMLNEAHDRQLVPEKSASMIILLTDGEANGGETDPEKIQMNAKNAIKGKYTLYSLGFGIGVNYPFLEKLALENLGVARRIYEDSDSSLQLQGFYNEVANPLLVDVQLQYPENEISDLTQNIFKNYYDGSEIVVAGRIIDNDLNTFTADVKGLGANTSMAFPEKINIAEREEAQKQQEYIFGDFTERLWAYLTIQQLLEKKIQAKGEEKENLTAQALDLSLKYNFVTPLTSMVVTKPEDDKKEEPLIADKPSEDEVADPSLRLQSSVQYHYNPSPASYSDHFDASPVLYSDYADFLLLPIGPAPRERSTTNAPAHTERSATNAPAPTERSIKNVDYPDFIVQLPTQSDLICLNVIGELDDPLTLVADPNTGIFVDGRTEKQGQQSYFVSFEIEYKDLNVSLTASKDGLTIQSHQGKTILDWYNLTSLKLDSLEISFVKRSIVIKADGKVTINLSYVRSVKHLLRLHLTDVQQFSNIVTGLLGRFYVNTSFVSSLGEHPTTTEKLLSVDGQEMKAIKTIKKNYKTNANPANTISCWTVDVQQS